MPVHEAARTGHIEVVRMLIKNFESPPDSKDVNGCTPLLLACRGGHLDIVVFLTTEFEYDVNACQEKSRDTALHCACALGNLEIVQYLISACKADVKAENVDGNTPLLVCGSPDAMRFLLSTCDMDVSTKGNQGMTPLHYACWRCWTDVVKYLIEEKQCDPQ